MVKVLGETAFARGAKTTIAGIDWNQFESWDAYHKTVSSKIRKEQRRQRKRLAEEGNVEVREISGNELPEAIDWLLNQKTASLEAMARDDHGMSTDDYRQFLHEAADRADDRDAMTLLVLEVDGEPIAASIVFRNTHVTDCWICTYDPKWSKFAPGMLLFEELLKRTSQSSDVVDFGPGDQTYKLRWASHQWESWHYIQPMSLWGRFHALAWFTKWQLDPLRKRYRRWKDTRKAKR